ncbi:MAG: hypothetical protein AAB871_03870, partial [Patescibacteria group bacterium]
RVIEPIVCGASNFEVGDMVALALPGAKVKDQHDPAGKTVTLQKATIRGVESQGMICSGFELGLSSQPEKGILLLKDDETAGKTFSPEMIR